MNLVKEGAVLIESLKGSLQNDDPGPGEELLRPPDNVLFISLHIHL